MRILFLTLDFPPNFGGVANYYYNLCKHLEKKNNIIVLAPLATNQDYNLELSAMVLRRKMLYKKICPRWLAALFSTWSILRNQNIDLIIVGHVLPLGYISLLCRLFFNIPYFVCAHGLDILEPQKNKRKFFWLKQILFFAKHIIVNSNYTRNEIIKIGIVSNKTIIVYPCINIEAPVDENVCAALKTKHNLMDKKIILSVGRLVERKGFDVVINAMKDVWNSFPDVVYIIIGSGAHKSVLQQLVGNKNKIIFLDHVTVSDLCLYYSICDIFIMTPKNSVDDPEGFGIVFLEANYFQKPVIGSRSGGVPEAVIHELTGLLVSPNSIEETSFALLRLLSDQDLRQRLGQKGKARVLSQFQWPLEVKKLQALLDNIKT